MIYGIDSVRPLPFKLAPVERKGMTDEGKMSYAALPPDARAYLDQWDDYTTKPKHNNDNDDVWFCNAFKDTTRQDVPDSRLKPLPYGTLACFRPKTHLDFHDPYYSKVVSDQEFNAWKRYRESLPRDSRLLRYIDPTQNQAKVAPLPIYKEEDVDTK